MKTETKQAYRTLVQNEIQRLIDQGCTASDWNAIAVAHPFYSERVVHVDFVGTVRIGNLAPDSVGDQDPTKPVGLYRATIANCELGVGVRIANVAGHLAGYKVGDGATIENVGVMETHPGSQFGAGVKVAVLNEAGGREVPLFNQLSSQFAHLLCLYRYHGDLIERLQDLADSAAAANRRDVGTVGAGARVTGVPKIVGVDIGAYAVIDSAQSLVNGTILSHPDARTMVKDAVIASHFIVAEGSQVSGAVILDKTFVGQGCQVGKQFSAENCLLFANCEAFHGEGCSALAGPYTVTHHKSTLLIGGQFSFFNAGSATNQSNHRYKLGPTHEGKLERGCKTGSSSYVMWPCRVGPFSVVLGKHTRNFDTADLPFSHVEADSAGRCQLIPGHYIATVGTLRDGSKWPRRDRRQGPIQRDIISFDVFSPFTIGRMQRGLRRLDQLIASADRAVETVSVGGVEIKRVLLRTGRKRYAASVERYLLEQIVQRAELRCQHSAPTVRNIVESHPDAVYSESWLDVGGQLMPEARLQRLREQIATGTIENTDQLHLALTNIHGHYAEDVWIWVKTQATETGLLNLADVTPAQLQETAQCYFKQQAKFLRLVLIDAQREFDEVSQTGFGVDGAEGDVIRDFQAVRGRYEDNRFVITITEEISQLPDRCQRICTALAKLA